LIPAQNSESFAGDFFLEWEIVFGQIAGDPAMLVPDSGEAE
jgi:hypothetical protein